MGWKEIDIVLKARLKPPTLKLTAVVLAGALNHKTQQLNPSLQRIADGVGVERRQAQRSVQALIGMGLVSVIANRSGGKPGTTPNYRLHLDRFAELLTLDAEARTDMDVADDTPTDVIRDTPTDVADDIPSSPERDVAGDADGCHGRQRRVSPMTPTGVTHDTRTGKGTEKRTRKRTEKERASARTPVVVDLLADVDQQIVSDWLAVRKDKRAKTLTATAVQGLRREAGKLGITASQAVKLCTERSWISIDSSWDSAKRAAAEISGKRSKGFEATNYAEGLHA